MSANRLTQIYNELEPGVGSFCHALELRDQELAESWNRRATSEIHTTGAETLAEGETLQLIDKFKQWWSDLDLAAPADPSEIVDDLGAIFEQVGTMLYELDLVVKDHQERVASCTCGAFLQEICKSFQGNDLHKSSNFAEDGNDEHTRAR